VDARYFYWPRLSEGSRYKKKKDAKRMAAKNEKAKEKEREQGASSESIR